MVSNNSPSHREATSIIIMKAPIICLCFSMFLNVFSSFGCLKEEGIDEKITLVGVELVNGKSEVIYPDFQDVMNDVRLSYFGVHDVAFIFELKKSISALLNKEDLRDGGVFISFRFSNKDVSSFSLDLESLEKKTILLRGICSESVLPIKSFIDFELQRRKKAKPKDLEK